MSVLTEEFLYELFGTALTNDKVGATVALHLKDDYLPNRYYQKINKQIRQFWSEYKEIPSFGVLCQSLSDGKDTRCSRMVNEFQECASNSPNVVLDQLEKYIRDVKTKQVIEKCVKFFNNSETEKSVEIFQEHTDWLNSFSLKPVKMTDVFSTFGERYKKNKNYIDSDKSAKNPVTRFYIDEIDKANDGRSLRGQLSVALASSGVGKSHFARHIGLNASLYDGLNVLHIQLEGTEKEVLDAYSASVANANSFEFEQATLSDDNIQEALDVIAKTTGTLMVRSYSKFGADVSTLNIKEDCEDFREAVGKYPDLLIVDSMDLLTDFRKTKKAKEELRHLRLSVAEDLKNLAMECDMHVFATYQATIESQEFLDDPNKVLTRYNSSEAKGIIRPVTNFLTMNQTTLEKDENSMRLFIDKARFFKNTNSGNRGVVRIKCNYDKGQFYDSDATMRLIGTQ